MDSNTRVFMKCENHDWNVHIIHHNPITLNFNKVVLGSKPLVATSRLTGFRDFCKKLYNHETTGCSCRYLYLQPGLYINSFNSDILCVSWRIQVSIINIMISKLIVIIIINDFLIHFLTTYSTSLKQKLLEMKGNLLLKLPCWMVYLQACHQLSSNRQLGIQISCPTPQHSTNLLYQGVVALLHGWVLFSWMHSNQARKPMAAP